MEPVTFIGFRIPLEVKTLLGLLPKIDAALVQQVFQLAFQHTLGHTISEERFEQVAASGAVERSVVASVFTGLLHVLRTAIRQRVAAPQLQKDLTDLKMPPPLVADFVKAVKASAVAEQKLAEQRVRHATLDQLKWRCDVGVSSSHLGRVLKPTVIMEMRTSDGQRKVFEVSTERFQQLRYNVSRVLHDMHELQRLAILKIAPKP